MARTSAFLVRCRQICVEYSKSHPEIWGILLGLAVIRPQLTTVQADEKDERVRIEFYFGFPSGAGGRGQAHLSCLTSATSLPFKRKSLPHAICPTIRQVVERTQYRLRSTMPKGTPSILCYHNVLALQLFILIYLLLR